MLDGRVLGASQVEYKPFGKPPLKREDVLRSAAGASSSGPGAGAAGLAFRPQLPQDAVRLNVLPAQGRSRSHLRRS